MSFARQKVVHHPQFIPRPAAGESDLRAVRSHADVAEADHREAHRLWIAAMNRHAPERCWFGRHRGPTREENRRAVGRPILEDHQLGRRHAHQLACGSAAQNLDCKGADHRVASSRNSGHSDHLAVWREPISPTRNVGNDLSGFGTGGEHDFFGASAWIPRDDGVRSSAVVDDAAIALPVGARARCVDDDGRDAPAFGVDSVHPLPVVGAGPLNEHGAAVRRPRSHEERPHRGLELALLAALRVANRQRRRAPVKPARSAA